MKRFTTKSPTQRSLFILFLLSVALPIAAQTTYKLEKVTSVEADGLYVFEQKGYVMNNAVSSNALQTTNLYKTTGLTGTETYVWTLEQADKGYKMKNVSRSSKQYLYNKSGGTNVGFDSSSPTATDAKNVWKFTFQTDGTVAIQCVNSDNRVLGYSSATDPIYKAYASGYVGNDAHPNAVNVYRLVEGGGTDPVDDKESSAVYVKVTSDDEIISGQYLLVYEDESLAFNGGLSALDAASNTIPVQIAAGRIAADDETNAAAFSIDITGTINGYLAGTIKSGSGYYIGATSDANSLAQSATTAYVNTFTINTGGAFADIQSENKPFIRFNAASNQKRFRYYKSESYAAQKPIQLYKKVPLVSISALGRATLYYGDRNLIVPEGVSADALIVQDGRLWISKTYQAGDVIPKGTGVMLSETDAETFAARDYVFQTTSNAGTVPTQNMLNGTDIEQTVSREGYRIYILSTPDSDPTNPDKVGFFMQTLDGVETNGTKALVPAHKAYLEVPVEDSGDAKSFRYDKTATAIGMVHNEQQTVDNRRAGWYTIDGRRLHRQPTQKGIYLHNGRKVVITSMK